MNNKRAALDYLNKGLKVIPLWSPSLIKRKPPNYFVDELNRKLESNKEEENPLTDDQVYEKLFIEVCKRPIIKWKQYQDRMPTTKEVSEWFDMWPDANIAIITGKNSGLVVFDLDSEHAVDYAENKGGFPDSPKVQTGKGWHIFSQHPGFEISNDVNKKLDIDIRADGGYVVAPPSFHGSGRQYEWIDGFSIFDIDPAPCSPWMIDYLKEMNSCSAKPTKKTTPKPSDNRSTASQSTTDNHYADIMKSGAQQGNRNHCATKLIGHLLGKGNDPGMVWEMVRQWNITKNTPPVDETELQMTFESIKKLNDKNPKKAEKKKEIDVTAFLDTEERITAEFREEYVKIPFAGNLLPIMQSKMNGGLIGGRTYVLGGIPSAGKTNLINNMADNICLNGHPVLFFSYDDGVSELRCRTFCRFSGFEIEDFNQYRVTESDLKAIYRNDYISVISKSKYVVQNSIKLNEWPQLIDKIYARHQKAPVIIVDYLRKVKTESNRLDERLRVDEILSGLTEISKTYNLPVVVVSELSRESYKSGQRLGMTSFKESGNIEYEASWLGILAAVEDDGYTLKSDWERIINHDGNIDLIVLKAKRGTGVTGRIPLKLDKSKMTVRDRIVTTKTDSVTQLRKKSKFA